MSLRSKAWYIICFLLTPIVVAAQEELHVMAARFPPYNFLVDDEPVGFSSEIVQEIFERIGDKNEIKTYPLARAELFLLNDTGQVLLSRLRTPQRESLSSWVGPLGELNLVFFARKEAGIVIPDLESAKAFKVGAALNSAGHELLLRNGFPNIAPIPRGTRHAQSLRDGRVDLWLTAEPIGRYSVIQEGGDPDFMEVVYEFEPVRSIFIAFSKDVPDEVIATWQKALDDMKADGTYAEIALRYGLPTEP